MSFRRNVLSLLVCAGVLVVGVESQGTQEDGDQLRKLMQSRMSKVNSKYATSKANDQPIELHKTPLLRFSDPTRQEIDGALWLFREGSIPVALLGLTYYGDEWSYEHLSLTDRSLKVTGEESWKWQPKEKAREWFPLDDPVSEKPSVRKIQMRSVLRQLSASETWLGETYVLRLVPSPLYLYSDEEASILEGGLFAISHGTNPEVIVQIEARSNESGKSAWIVSFARLSSAKVAVSLKEEVLWEAPQVMQWNAREDYYGHSIDITEPILGK